MGALNQNAPADDLLLSDPKDIDLLTEPLHPVGPGYHLKLPRFCTGHRGADPVWRGAPSVGRIRMIQGMTTHDSDGNFYWRKPGESQIRKLKTAEDYRRFKKALDEWVDFSVR